MLNLIYASSARSGLSLGTGLTGWALIKRTKTAQTAALAKRPMYKNEIENFKKTIGTVDTAEKLVGNYRLLKFALAVFGLESEVSKKAFLRKVLEGGTEASAAPANKLSDTRFREFAEAFGYGNGGGAKVAAAGFAERIVEGYTRQKFEEAVGAADDNLRQALYFERSIEKVAKGTNADRTGWYSIMGQIPLRKVIEGAFGLPNGFSRLDVDAQKTRLENRAFALFGSKSVTSFLKPANIDKTIRLFLARTSISAPFA